jgi:hypothetical protein
VVSKLAPTTCVKGRDPRALNLAAGFEDRLGHRARATPEAKTVGVGGVVRQ